MPERSTSSAPMQQVAMYAGSSTGPKEIFAYHVAGHDGRGGSSYIDEAVLRDRDTNADGTLEELHQLRLLHLLSRVIVDRHAEVVLLRLTTYRRNPAGATPSHPPSSRLRPSPGMHSYTLPTHGHGYPVSITSQLRLRRGLARSTQYVMEFMDGSATSRPQPNPLDVQIGYSRKSGESVGK